MTMDPTSSRNWWLTPAQDAAVLQKLGRMKEFDVKAWVNDSYIRKAYGELGLDYEAQLKSLANYEVSGQDGFCKVAITEPRKAGEIWIEGEGIKAYSSPACTLGALAELKGQGKKVFTAYLFDTAQGIKLFASEAFYAAVTKDGKTEIQPSAEEGRRSRRWQRGQGADIRRSPQERDLRTGMSQMKHSSALASVAVAPERFVLEPGGRRAPAPSRCCRPAPRARPLHPAGPRLARWLRLNRGMIRATLLGLLSLGLFIALWHVLTANRINIYVRFMNVPSPEQVLASAEQASPMAASSNTSSFRAGASCWASRWRPSSPCPSAC